MPLPLLYHVGQFHEIYFQQIAMKSLYISFVQEISEDRKERGEKDELLGFIQVGRTDDDSKQPGGLFGV